MKNGHRALQIAMISLLFATAIACGGGSNVSGGNPNNSGGTSNGSGGTSAPPPPLLNLSPLPLVGAVPKFAYALNNVQASNISMWTVDPDDGHFRPNGIMNLPTGIDSKFFAVDAAGRFVWVVGHDGLNNYYLMTYVIGVNGRLTSTGARTSLGTFPAYEPSQVVVEPTGRFMYTANRNTGQLQGFLIGPASGALTPISSMPLTGSFTQLVIHPSGKLLYASGTNGLSGYVIDAISGRLSPVAGSPFQLAGTATSISLHPSGKFLYVTDFDHGIQAFLIDGRGVVTTVGSLISANGAISSAIESSGKYFIVGINSTQAHIKVYAVNSVTGALQATQAQADVLQPIQITADPTSGTIYVADGAANAIVRYKIDSSGSLTRLGWALAYAGPTQLGLVRGDRVAKYVPMYAYISNQAGNSISGFAVNADTGALIPIGTSAIASGAGPRSIASDIEGRYVYVANSSTNNISGFAVDQTSGALSAIPGALVGTRGCPLSLVVDPSGTDLKVANQDTEAVWTDYQIDRATGGLTWDGGAVPYSGFTPPPCASAGVGVTSISQGPSGRHTFVTFAGTPNSGVDSFAGWRVSGSPFKAGTTPVAATVHPEGDLLYVVNRDSNDITAFLILTHSTSDIDNTGWLLQLAASPIVAGTSPSAIAGDANGKFFYVTNTGSNNISGYRFNPTTGGLDPLPGSPFAAGAAPVALAVDTSGKFLYVVERDSNAVSVYAIDAQSGVPTQSGRVSTGASPVAITLTESIQ